jgi:hypothetical protein
MAKRSFNSKKATYNSFVGLMVIIISSHSHDRMVVGFTTTYAISAYHH